MQRWEYCAIIGVSREAGAFSVQNPGYVVFTSEGPKPIEIPGKPISGTAALIASLGLHGWELVGVGNVSAIAHTLYFKRPLES